MSSRPDWCTNWVPGHPGLLHREILSWKTNTQTRQIDYWGSLASQQLSTQWETLFQKTMWTAPRSDTWGCLLASICMCICLHIHLCVCTHTYTHKYTYAHTHHIPHIPTHTYTPDIKYNPNLYAKGKRDRGMREVWKRSLQMFTSQSGVHKWNLKDSGNSTPAQAYTLGFMYHRSDCGHKIAFNLLLIQLVFFKKMRNVEVISFTIYKLL